MLTRFASSFAVARNVLRGVSTTPAVFQEAEVGKEEFLKKWEKLAPASLKPPNFASDWTQPETDLKTEEEEKKTTELPKKLKLNLYMPSEILMEQAEVDL